MVPWHCGNEVEPTVGSILRASECSLEALPALQLSAVRLNSGSDQRAPG
jgi:hypothetical protein